MKRCPEEVDVSDSESRLVLVILTTLVFCPNVACDGLESFQHQMIVCSSGPVNVAGSILQSKQR